MVDIILLIIGVALLIKGGTGVINNSLLLAQKIKISPLIIGIIFVGIGTSLPEIFISIFSGLDKNTGIGLGNIVGSNIAHLCLFIGGVLLLIKRIHIGTVKTQQNAYIMLFLTIVFSILLILGKLTFVPGLLFIISALILITWQIKQGENGALHEDKQSMNQQNSFVLGEKLNKIYFLLFISILMLLLGGKLVVDSGTRVAMLLGVSSFVIGATIVAVGTSLPELVVTIKGALTKKGDKLVIGNILGSNIYNILICGGILGLYNVGGTNNIFAIVMLIISCLFFITLVVRYKGQEIPRYIGVILLLLYVIYLGSLII
jgi:cation:H+ antiporter